MRLSRRIAGGAAAHRYGNNLEHGDLLAVPEDWAPNKRPPIIIITEGRAGPAASLGDRVLAKIKRAGAYRYHAQVIRLLPKEPPKSIVGIFIPVADGGGLIEPVSRKVKESYFVPKEEVNGAVAGELVKGATLPTSASRGLPHARIEERLGDAPAHRARQA